MKEKLEFIELNEDKSPKTNFSDTKESFEDFENAGLLLNDDVVVVDFDGDNKNENKIIDALETLYPSTLRIKTDKGKQWKTH